MNIATFCIERNVITLTLTFILLGAGLLSYQSMSRLEDPEYTIKEALVITPYPGASAAEVEEEVTDELELAIQQLGQLKEIKESKSQRGLSNITVKVKDRYDKSSLPQVWDELRRKIGDAQSKLPPGAGPSIVNDDYGDVFGVFVAIYGAEYSYAELKQVIDLLRREFALVQDVAKVQTFGERVEAVYIALSRDRMSQLGISDEVIIDELREKNLVTDSGRVRVGPEFITMEPTGGIVEVADFESILLSGGASEQIYLRDVATVRRGYVEPPDHLIRYDGRPAIGLGISTVSGGNVVTMGEALEKRLDELRGQLPLGIDAGIISIQSRAVVTSIQGFTTSLLQAVAIVIIVLLFFMGLRSGVIIGFILLVTIIGSFIFLRPMGVALERISLGALIIALGMLVDNAIVIVDGVLIKLQQGVEAKQAAADVVSQSAIPLFGATIIAIVAFAAIGTSDDSTGEFCRSLFQVVSVSLLLSWVTAVTITPLLCVMFLKTPEAGASQEDPYGGRFYAAYKAVLHGCVRFRWLTTGVVVAMFAASLVGFGYVDQSFFPSSTRAQFPIDFWLPQGTHLRETEAQAEDVERYLLEKEGVTHVTTLLGQGGLRFLLTYTPEKQESAYAQFLVDVEEDIDMAALAVAIEAEMAERFPDALTFASKFELGPAANGKIRARLVGPDPAVLRGLADQTIAILEADPNTKGVRTDWRQPVKVVRPILADVQADLNGIQRSDVARVLLQGFEGNEVGVYRERDLLLPIIIRAEAAERNDVSNIKHLQIWSPAAEQMIPLRQVVSSFETVFEDQVIMRRDRKRTITVFADPREGAATVVFNRVRPQIEALEFPPDYYVEWGGEYEDTNNAQGPLFASLPIFVGLMVLILIMLFNSLRQPAVIFLCVPLALIGVVVGLLSTRQPFGFMALLGFLSLSGMLIKNAVVLIDQINLELSQGKEPLAAIIDSGTSRLRPVAMAALTTALGMIPLLADAFFVAMAVTIIFGLVFATILTMVVVPVLYAIFFRVPSAGAAASATE